MHEIRTEKGDENTMITAAQLLGEIEQQVRLAKQTQDEAARREAIYAVRTLCNVMLNDERPSTTSIPQAMQMSSVHATPITSLNEQPLQEADANGESLFDF
ncbi:YwdI family protein [Sporosarcina sp. P20a]|uniref:YwdI family protein n=1 Tax=Sporosarcina sp. P20a TaxID=2048256 RepID=UPI0013044516|nr:YwdI family protein [Sporosarcina sp. P20a]